MTRGANGGTMPRSALSCVKLHSQMTHKPQVSLDKAPVDRMAPMTLKSAERFQNLIEGAGGSVSPGWVAQLLDTSEEAVKKRAQRNTLISRRTASGELSFPRFQFDGTALLFAPIQTLATVVYPYFVFFDSFIKK